MDPTVRRSSRLRRGLEAVTLALVTGAASLTAALPEAVAAPAAGAAAGELVLPAAPRGLPARDRLFVAGATGLLHAREGSDRLLWTPYDTGATTDTGLRLPAPLSADLDAGQPSRGYNGAPDHRYGTSSDTVAVHTAAKAKAPAKVDLYDLATGRPVALGTVTIPAGQTYYGTYGRTVLTVEGGDSAVTGWFLNRLDAGSTVRTKVALPAGAVPATSVHDGDQNSLILRHRLDDLTHSVLVDVVTGQTTALPDEGPYDFTHGFRLAKGKVLRTDQQNMVDVLDRAQPQTVLSSTYFNPVDGELRLLGDWLLGSQSVAGTSGDNRGRPLHLAEVGSTSGVVEFLLEFADSQLLPAPDGSLIAIGSAKAPEYGTQPQTAVHRITAAGAAKPQAVKLVDVPHAPATVFGLTIGGGVVTAASDTVQFQPGDITGAYRSYSVSNDATPVKTAEYLDGRHGISDCFSFNAGCVGLRSTGDGRYLEHEPVEQDRYVVVREAGNKEWAGTIPMNGESGMQTADVSGRYMALAQTAYGNWTANHQVIVNDLDTRTRVFTTQATGVALQGDTLWTSKEGSTTVSATDVRGGQARGSFTTPCPATLLEAVGRYVAWNCQDDHGTVRTSGVYDTVTRQTLSVPVQTVGWLNVTWGRESLLGDGYLVRQDLATGRLLLLDFHEGIKTSGGENTVQVRTLAQGDEWKSLRQPNRSWAVDRTGANIVWTDADGQRVHVANNGIPAVPAVPAGDRFTALSPARLLDTREALGRPGTQPVAAGGEVSLQVAGRAGVPQSGVKAVVLNVTVTDPKADGHLTAWPSGTTRPDSSNLNWAAGRTVPNQVVVPVGADGKVNLRVASPGTAHVIADVFGYYSADAGGSTFASAGPARLLDSRAAVGRPGTDPVPARGEVSLTVAGRAGVPQSGVKAVVLNVTLTDAKDAGHLTVWPSGTTRPNSSSLNWTAGQTVPNHVVVPVGADGKVKLYNASGGSAHLIADVFGYYSDDPAGATFRTAGPKRMFDTRTTSPVAARGSTVLDLSGSSELARAKAVVLNVTVTDPKSDGHLTAWPSGTTRPDSSNLNWTAGSTVANLVTVPVGADGKVEFANIGWGSAHVIVDLFGYLG
ncbi:hypothetical protein [Streptomyces antarcticus]|uniref:hypothetical protein n=1 Tax=Streptomyces antarcticus TaxID=2996458 RepID=UPI00226E7D7C|nr:MULTISPECIES: hypothetical protein [unclassified Streptomyces]MCY0945878.1 hypothetical protein [Streptomyces sp. H34-AA3]MCZ4085746.1 hypothetical protein [Streptomyces sp. H34-S5]